VDQRASLSRKRALPGGPPVCEASDATQGAPRFSGGGQGGNRGGNRGGQGGGGGRRRETYDYDYSGSNSSNADAGGGKVTTKLGDVYADLFAQFGLGGGSKKEEVAAAPAEVKPVVAEAAPVVEAVVEAAPVVEAATEAPAEGETNA
jgi:small subunit ribosomal protein S1